MSEKTFEMRICESCGLRYPLVMGHSHGTRCPICMGTTRVALSRELIVEPTRSLTPNPSPRFDFATAPLSASARWEFAVLLDNIRSAWNVGSIFRSADGFGFSHAYSCGITPTPENDAVQKTSLGAEDSVTWSHHKDAVKLIKGLKVEGWKVFALEEDARAVSITLASTTFAKNAHSAPPSGTSQRGILIVGNEVTGVDPELLDLCDEIFYIPMRGEKKSFNAAIAFGIAAYELQR